MSNMIELRKRMANGHYAQYAPACSMIAGGIISCSDGNAFWPFGKPFIDFTFPAFPTTRIVIVGCQGAGKSTLFNRLTDDISDVSDGTATCTRKNKAAMGKKPFDMVTIVDTPGMASHEIHYDDAYQLREAFIRKPVNMIALVASLPSNPRVAQIVTSLIPMNKIMNSSTFMLDRYGVVNPECRTRVMLVLTHRDTFKDKLPEKNWCSYVAQIRAAYDWIGGVVMVDRSVSDTWLLANIITPAACLEARDYNIPMSEFCSRFPISRELDSSEKLKIARKKVEFNAGMQLALVELDEVAMKRNEGYSGSSGYVEKLGPTIDCILRFLDDLYDRKSLEAVALLQKVEVEELWTGTDMNINQRRVELWNACKSNMGDEYESAKLMVHEHFPTRPTDAIYKKCNHCGVVYVKPIGCDFGTRCGNTIGGDDSLPFTYEYDDGKSSGKSMFSILEGKQMGSFENLAYKFRKQYSSMVSKNSKRFYGTGTSGAVVKEHYFEKGCQKLIAWSTMIPLTIKELEQNNLIPMGVSYEATAGPKKRKIGVKSNTMMVKLQKIVGMLSIDDNLALMQKIKQAEESIGYEGKGPARERVDILYEKLIGNDDE